MHQALTLEKENTLWKDAALVVGFSLILGILGKVMIPLPFTPVPLALRSELVLLMAALLGPKRASLAVLGFLAQGIVGLPVFTHGTAGWEALVDANGGYLIGYLAAAAVTGWLGKRHILSSQFAGMGIIYIFGAGYLATFVGISQAVLLGVVPFLIGDAIKIALNWKIIQFWRKRAS